jgi:hypothetical protein
LTTTQFSILSPDDGSFTDRRTPQQEEVVRVARILRRLFGSRDGPRSNALGDKLQWLALHHPEALRVIERLVDDMIRRVVSGDY